MLSKSTEYAIRALVYISLQNLTGRRPLITEISKEIESPQAFTAKILQILSRHRLVCSTKGRGGGFYFDDRNINISIYDVINVMEGDDLFYKCGFGLKNCDDNNPCPLHNRYKAVRDNYYRIVKEESIASLAKRIYDGVAVLNNIDRIKN